jgi:hypothetical protein
MSGINYSTRINNLGPKFSGLIVLELLVLGLLAIGSTVQVPKKSNNLPFLGICPVFCKFYYYFCMNNMEVQFWERSYFYVRKRTVRLYPSKRCNSISTTVPENENLAEVSVSEYRTYYSPLVAGHLLNLILLNLITYEVSLSPSSPLRH